MRKRFLPLLLCFCMIFSLSGGGSAMTAYAATQGYTALATALESGGQYIVTNADGTKAMSDATSSDGLAGVDITMNADKTTVSTEDAGGLEAFIWTSDDGKTLTLNDKKLKIATTVTASSYDSSQLEITADGGLKCTANGYYLLYENTAFSTGFSSGNVKVYKISMCAHENKIDEQHKDATCTEDGYDKFHCNDCDQDIETVIPATGHIFGEDHVCTVCGVFQATVGTGTSGYYYTPMHYGKYALTETIYPASELGAKSGKITSIAYQVYSSNVTQETTDFKIYMKHTAAGSFSSSTSYDLDDLTLVYSGTPILGGAKGSWNTFTLDTPFDYNGTDNLIVVIAKKATAAGTYPQLYYYYTNTPNSSLYRYDNSDESYADVANTTASNAYSSMYYRANIRVEMKLCDHDWVKGETVPPSCTEQGYTEYECQKCQSTKKDDIISATGHSRPSSGVEHKDAACTEDGYDKYECTTCHKPVTEVIPATGHDFEDNICKACGVYQVTVGEGVLTTYVSPMNTYVKNSLTETIYSAEEIGKAGSIESIAYHIAGAGTLETSSLKIYMKHTDADTFSSTSFDLEDLTLVYEGTPTIGGLKDEWETYQLDTPFKYNGTDNLIVAVSRISAVTGSTPTYYYTMASNTNLRRGNATNSDYAGITNNATGTRGSYKANIRLEMKTTGDTPTPSTYTVTFMNGNTEYAKEEVTAGGKVTTTVIDTPPVRQSEAQYYDFAGWSSDGGRTVLTAAQVKENVVNAAVTYEAVFTPKEFSVEKDEKQAAGDAETAFYNTDYTGHIAGYAADHDYSVTYTVGDGEAREVTVGTDGSFTIPGASITGNLTIAITDDTQAAEPPMDQMKTYYIISTPEQLAWYAAQTETAGYAVGAYLDADIDMSSYDWNPMGGNSAGNGYKGTFDGNGNTITIDMSQTDSAPNNSGLFDFIAKGGVVKNVVLAGSVKGGAYVGGIASQNYGTIQNCINKASVAAEASNTVMAGGIVGNNYATIENCANQGAIDAKSTTGTMSTIHAGGIAGKLSLSPNTDPQNSCSISKCYNTGSVSAASSTTLYLSNTYVGGIAGYYGTPSNANKVSIEDCYSTGTLNAEGVSAGNKYIGGIVGAGYASKDDDSKDYERVTLNRCWYLSGTAEKTINGAVTSGPSDNPCCVETNTGAKTASELKSTSFFTQIEGYKSDSRTNPINGGYPVLQWQTTEGGEDPEPQPAAVWDGTLDFSWYNEDDVQTDYYISTPAQWEALAWICSEHLDKLKDEATYKSYTNGNITNIIGTVPTKQNTFAGVTFYLEKDIDMGGVYDEASGTWSGKNYYPIGSQAADDAGTGNFYGEFYGSFDGQGHTVKNVYCDRGTGQNAQAVGLFGRVGERDKDKGDTSPYTEVSGDIVIENVAVTGYIKSGRSVGGIVGKTLHVSDGHKIVIRNCVNYADVTSTDSKGVGGIAGALWNSAEIESCINFGDVTFSYSKACAGGIAGDNDGKNVVRKSINFGTIHFTGSGQRAAGTIIGNDNSKPEQADNCYYLEGCITEEDSAADSGILYYGEEVSEKEAKSSALAEKLGSSYKSSCGEYPVLSWQTAKEHQYGEPVDVPADCVTDAHKESTCSQCGDVKISDVQTGTANGEHDWDNGVCKKCGATLAAEAVVAPAELDLSGTAETVTLKLKAAATTDVKLAGVEFTLSLPEGFSVSKDGITSEALKNITYDATTGRVLCYVTDGENAAVGEFPVEIAILVPAAAAADTYNVGFSNIVFAVYDGDNLSKSALKQDSANAELTVTVSAQPIVKHKVTFVSNGGSEVDSQDVNNGEKAVKPEDPARADYTFTGWYTDEACTKAFDFDTPVTTDLTLYAGWKADSTGGGSGGGSGGSGGSGGGSAPSDDKNIEIQNGTGGTVSVSPQDAEKGDEVTITVKPDSGYLADQVKVTDKNGTAIDVTDHGDGTYTFTMPSGKVTVDVTYKTDAAPGSGNFADVARGAWYEEAVNYVAENGYFKGVSDTLFDPDGTMTRAMFATAVGRMAGIDESRYTGSAFSDVPEGQWYSAYVKWASDNGIVNGVGGGMFEPDTKITREQMAAMLYRYAEYAGVDVTSAAGASAAFAAFPDSASVSGYAKDAMIWAVGAGVINGSDGELQPQADATRAQVAQIIMNYAEKIK